MTGLCLGRLIESEKIWPRDACQRPGPRPIRYERMDTAMVAAYPHPCATPPLYIRGRSGV